MPVHDGTRVDAGTFHSFHNAWITHLMGRLNGGVLPQGYYALSEQYASGPIPDVLTLHRPDPSPIADPAPREEGIALADAPLGSVANRPRTPRPSTARGAAPWRSATRAATGSSPSWRSSRRGTRTGPPASRTS
jgi:hypothetical protein